MAIGLRMSQPAGRRRAGRVKNDQELDRSSVREVCLIGLDRRSTGDWTTGQEIAWLGRKYQVLATARESPPPIAVRAGDAEAPSRRGIARQYVHLAPCVGD